MIEPSSLRTRRFQADWRREFGEGEIVALVFGRRIRLYAGHSYASRPRAHHWRGYGSQGIVLRAHRDCREQRVLGLQWRRAS